jgi:hypothetical protein
MLTFHYTSVGKSIFFVHQIKEARECASSKNDLHVKNGN